jgi:AcrR family transcriptional regulator
VARILDAVAAEMTARPDADISFDRLAEITGISRRTIFRHFPTKDALLRAFWARVNAGLGLQPWPADIADLTRLPPDLFEALDRIAPIVRAAHSSGLARDMRLAANPERQAAFRSALAPLTDRLPPDRALALTATTQLLYSAAAAMILDDHWGLKGRAAGEAVAWAIAALIAAAERDATPPTDRKDQP